MFKIATLLLLALPSLTFAEPTNSVGMEKRANVQKKGNNNGKKGGNKNGKVNGKAGNGQCPAGSSFAVSPKCHDAKTSTTPQGGPQFALFDNRCKGELATTSKSDKDELCCTGCSDGLLCRAPDALKGIQTCRDGTAPDFSSGKVKFVKKSVSPASCGAANFSKPECGGAKGGV
ncbi:hypothetical protein HDV06_006400 [Boothiomyces sp. JEL0866]|nr:hypothetical protein HDV06_006400 [Boothiomyces sp. JEL0866]